MKDIEIIKNLVDKLDGVMTLEINPHTKCGKQRLEALANSKQLFVVSPLSDRSLQNDTTGRYANKEKLDLPQQENISYEISSSNICDVGLTKREKEVLALIASALSNKLIARKLDISCTTVKVHVKNILSKLNKHSRLEAAIWAVKQNTFKEINDHEKNI